MEQYFGQASPEQTCKLTQNVHQCGISLTHPCVTTSGIGWDSFKSNTAPFNVSGLGKHEYTHAICRIKKRGGKWVACTILYGSLLKVPRENN